jgi:dihydrofolate reductase
MIKARMGVSLDGYVSTPDGMPALLSMPDFVPGVSHGYPEFIKGCDAVVMGRNSFLPALGAPRWPWPGLEVHVLTSSPLPSGAPPGVVTEADPAALAELLRSRPSGGDVHLVGGVRTIAAFHQIGQLDRLEIVLLPIILGAGNPLSPLNSAQWRLRQLGDPRRFPDGSIEVRYSPT